MQVWRMRTGISITLKPIDRRRLTTVAWDRNAPHKHVWRAEIVLLSADGVGTNEIMQVEDLCVAVAGTLHAGESIAGSRKFGKHLVEGALVESPQRGGADEPL